MSDTLTPIQGRIVEGLTPGQLTDLRSALVNNATFAGLAVRNGFHTHLKYNNTQLMHVIDTFVKFQEERDFEINEEVLILSEDEPYMGEHVNIPKTLGDLFESLAGAVFLDTGMDLQATWSVFYKLMWREIEMFRRNVPISPVRMLYENVKASPKFGHRISKPIIQRINIHLDSSYSVHLYGAVCVLLNLTMPFVLLHKSIVLAFSCAYLPLSTIRIYSVQGAMYEQLTTLKSPAESVIQVARNGYMIQERYGLDVHTPILSDTSNISSNSYDITFKL
ncbi:Dicer-1 [Carabus blaptoides fortunei]